MINFFFEDIDEFDIKKTDIEKNIEKLVINENRILGDVNYILCSDNYLLNINREYLNHDYFTDVISFDYCEDNVISGDIFISVDTVSDNAKEYGATFENELERVMIHGVLHFVGYNDKTESDQKTMRAKENQYLSLFK
ncbi:MAG: rRNA maturation RNase YbeY [Salinivirgaceae bacterium]|nr:rRNA maturation RNase YbeY [Salinivirgaceae bacterium]